MKNVRRVIVLILCMAGIVSSSRGDVSLTIPKAQHPPEIDGVISDDEWNDAVAVTGIINQLDGVAHPRQATFWLKYDDEKIYIAQRSTVLPQERHTRAPQLWGRDSSIVICLAPGRIGRGDEPSHYKLRVNLGGATRTREITWKLRGVRLTYPHPVWQIRPAEGQAQDSGPVHLEAGKKYYIKALQKEGGGGDHLAVAWQGPGFQRKIIDGKHLSPFSEEPAETGSILREWWTSIPGTAVSQLTSDPNYPDKPTGRQKISTFECPVDWANNYGTRVHGFIHPPETGEYRLWIAGDDNCELWLSSDESPSNAKLIASVVTFTRPREWDKYRSDSFVDFHPEAMHAFNDDESEWTSEIAIPLSSMNVDSVADGEAWRVFLARDYSWAEQNAITMSSDWRFGEGHRHFQRAFYNNYRLENEYASAVLSDNRPVVQVLELGDLSEATAQPQIAIFNPTDTALAVDAKFKVETAHGVMQQPAQTQRIDIRPKQRVLQKFNAVNVPDGRNLMQISVTDVNGQVIYSQNLPFTPGYGEDRTEHVPDIYFQGYHF